MYKVVILYEKIWCDSVYAEDDVNALTQVAP